MAPKKFDCYMVAVDIGSDSRLARLSSAEFRAYVAGVLAVAAGSRVPGRLLVGPLPADAPEIAAAGGVSRATARSALDKLQDSGVLEADPVWHCLRVAGWRKLHARSRQRAIPRAVRQAVILRDGMVCGICGGIVESGELEIDHVEPVSLGGSDHPTNLQVSHRPCNRRKAARR